MSSTSQWFTRTRAQSVFEARMILRNGEQLMVAIIFPIALLILLATTDIVDLWSESTTPDGTAKIDVLAPGILAAAIMTTAFTSQAIATAFDRRNGVLRLMATTPLGKSGLLAGKIAGVFAVQIVQIALIVPVAFLLGWHPNARGIPAALGVWVLGTIAFTALAMLIAGVLRAEAVLAVANIILAALIIGGGVVAPLDRLPEPLGTIALFLPSGAMGEALRGTFTVGTVPAIAVVVLVGWSTALGWGVTRLFKWN